MKLRRNALDLIGSVAGYNVWASPKTIVAIYGSFHAAIVRIQIEPDISLIPSDDQAVAIYPDGDLRIVTFKKGRRKIRDGGKVFGREEADHTAEQRGLIVTSDEAIAKARESIARLNAGFEHFSEFGILGFCVIAEEVGICKGRIGKKDVLLRHSFDKLRKPIDLQIVHDFDDLLWKKGEAINTGGLDYVHPDIFRLLVE